MGVSKRAKSEPHQYVCITYQSIGDRTFDECERVGIGPRAEKYGWKGEVGWTYGPGPPGWSDDISVFSTTPLKRSPYLRR